MTESAREREIPYIISLDDHVIEPPNVWQDRLPAKYRDVGPRVVRDTYSVDWVNGNQVFRKGGDGPTTDWWLYEDLAWSHQMLERVRGLHAGRVVDGPDRVRPDAARAATTPRRASPTWS